MRYPDGGDFEKRKNTLSIISNKIVRRILLPLFRIFNPGNITIRHHYTSRPVYLHSFKHKGYWFHGKERERETFEIFSKILKKGDCVIEVGGHIGYLAMYFSHSIGDSGRLFVFEPGENNLPYTKRNLSQLNNTVLIEKAVSDSNGKLHFYLEDLTGQNNSLVQDYQAFKDNVDNSVGKLSYREVEIESVTLDTFVRERELSVQFIKIDVEGAEKMVLSGARQLISAQRPCLMVEVTKDHAEVFDFFNDLGYNAYTEQGNIIEHRNDLASGNVFLFHRDQHKQIITSIGGK